MRCIVLEMDSIINILKPDSLMAEDINLEDQFGLDFYYV